MRILRLCPTSVLAVLLAVLPLSSCGGGGRIDSELDRAESLMGERPDSSLGIIRGIDTASLRSGRLKARRSLLLSMALDKNRIDTTDARVIMPAVEYYEAEGTPDEKLKALYYLGRVQMNAKDYNKAVVTLTRAVRFSDDAKDRKMAGFSFSALAELCSLTSNFLECDACLDKAAECFNESNEKRFYDLMEYRKAQNAVATYRFAEADSIYLSIVVDEAFPMEIRVAALSSFGLMLILQTPPEPERSLAMFSKSLELSGRAAFRDVNLQGAFAFALEMAGRHAESQEAFKVLSRSGEHSDPHFKYWQGRICRLAGKSDEAYDLLLASLRNKDSLALAAAAQTSTMVQRDYFRKENIEMEKTVARQRTRSIVIFALCLFSLSFLIWLFNKMRRRNAEERRKLALLARTAGERLDESLSAASLQESRVGVLKDELSVLKNDYLELYKAQGAYLSVMSEILVLSADKDGKPSGENVVRRLSGMTIGPDSDDGAQRMMEKTLNGIFSNVITRFRKDFPSWDEADIRFFSCSVARFDASLLSKLLGFPSKDAVYMKRRRLKEKIRESESSNKDQYLLLF